MLLDLLRQVRRYKAERSLSVSTELDMLHISAPGSFHQSLSTVLVDLKSATRARQIVVEELGKGSQLTDAEGRKLFLAIP